MKALAIGIAVSIGFLQPAYAQQSELDRALSLYQAGRQKEAFNIASRLSKRGYLPAMHALCTLYLFGHGTRRNIKTAKHWCEKAAKSGNTDAMQLLYTIYRPNSEHSAEPVKAFYWSSKLANAGVAEGNLQLGYLYYIGYGTYRNKIRAYAHYFTAAKQKNSPAMLNISYMHESGDINRVDLARAYAWSLLAQHFGYDTKNRTREISHRINKKLQDRGRKIYKTCIDTDFQECR